MRAVKSQHFDQAGGLEQKTKWFHFCSFWDVFFNANVFSGLQAQIIICLLALLLRAADEIFLWLLYYMLSKKLANCVCLFPCSVCLERGDWRGIFVVHWADPVLQGWAAPQHDFGWWWRSYQPSSYQIPRALERWLVFVLLGPVLLGRLFRRSVSVGIPCMCKKGWGRGTGMFKQAMNEFMKIAHSPRPKSLTRRSCFHLWSAWYKLQCPVLVIFLSAHYLRVTSDTADLQKASWKSAVFRVA